MDIGSAPKSLVPVALKVNAEERFESGCFLPIMRGNRTLGVLHLLDRRRNAFSEEDVDFLRQVAGQVAIALENALESAMKNGAAAVKKAHAA